MRQPRFCLLCGAPLIRKIPPYDNKERDACSRCDFVYYPQPKVAAGTITVIDSKVVLIRRGVEPGYGKWSFPCGFVEAGERLEDAAVRETEEETGYKVRLLGLHGLYTGLQPERHVIIACYRAEVIGGEPRPSDDALEVRLYSRDEIPWLDLAFQASRQFLAEWVNGRPL